MKTIFATAALAVAASARPLDSYDTEVDCAFSDIHQLVNGVMYGVTEEGNLTQLGACLADADQAGQDLKVVVGDLKKGDLNKAIADLVAIAGNLPQMLNDCKPSVTDPEWHALAQWLSIATNLKAMFEQFEKNTVENFAQFRKDLVTLQKDINAGDYFNAGKTIADIAMIEFGPMPPVQRSEYDFDFDWTSLIQ